MKIKVCGLTQPGQMETLDTLGVDYLGMIFYSKSPRFVREGIFPKTQAKKVGVFVNETLETIARKVETFDLKVLQIHGDETLEDFKRIQSYFPTLEVWRALSIDSDLQAYAGADALVLDTPTKGYGGSGKTWDWERMQDLEVPAPVFLSGGISPENITKALQTPVFGLDLNSGFETGPGIKDLNKINYLYEHYL